MTQGVGWFFGGIGLICLSGLVPLGFILFFAGFVVIVFGLIEFFIGLAPATGRTNRNKQAQHLLRVAAQLEVTDPARAVAVYQEIVRIVPGDPASDDARRRLQKLNARGNEGTS